MNGTEMLAPSSFMHYIPGGARSTERIEQRSDALSPTKWVLDDDDEFGGERELHFGDCTVEWSKVSPGGSRLLVRSLTMQSKIRDAFFARFRVAPDGLCETDESSDDSTNSLQCGVGVFDESGVFSFFDEAGNDYRVRIEFTVERIVPLRVGVLIERKWSPGSTPANTGDSSICTSLYYLQHPLDLINSVVAVVNEPVGDTQYRTTSFREHKFIAFTSCSKIRRSQSATDWFEESPPCDLLLTFSEAQQRCSIWHVRVPTREEQLAILRHGVATHAEADEAGSHFNFGGVTTTPQTVASSSFAFPVPPLSATVRSRNATARDRHSIAVASTRFGTPFPPIQATEAESNTRVLERMAEALRLDSENAASPANDEKSTRSAHQSLTATRRRTLAGALPNITCTPSVCWTGMTPKRGGAPSLVAGNTSLSKFDLLNAHSHIESTILNDPVSASLASLSPGPGNAHERFLPELLLERVLVDEPVRQSARAATDSVVNAFSTVDLLGEHWLCYLLASESTVRLIRIDLVSEEEDSRSWPVVKVGKRDRVAAGDGHTPLRAACPIRRARMWAALDASGGLFLYSGSNLMGKLAVAQHFEFNAPIFKTPRRSVALKSEHTQAARARSPHNRSFTEQPTSARKLPSEPGSTAAADSVTAIAPHRCAFSNIAMPSCGDVSLTASTVTSAQTAPAPVLSGVDGQVEAVRSVGGSPIETLRDSTDCRFSVLLVDGSLYRVGISPLCSSVIVDRCFAALGQLLAAADWHALARAWYVDTRALFRRTPASTLHTDADAAELRAWVHFLLTTQFGFRYVHRNDRRLTEPARSQPNTMSTSSQTQVTSDRLARIAEESLLGSDSKRPRCDNSIDGSLESTGDADWLFFAADAESDDPNVSFFAPLRRFIAPAGSGAASGHVYSLDAAATRLPSWKWAAEALSALHLVYEEAKIGSLRAQLAELALLLLALARSLRLPAFIDFYTRDLLALAPAHLDLIVVNAEVASRPHQLSEPASIFDFMHDLLTQSHPIQLQLQFPVLVGVNPECVKVITVTLLYVAANDPTGSDWNEAAFRNAFECIATGAAQKERAQRSLASIWHSQLESWSHEDTARFSADERFVHALVSLGISEKHVAKWPAAIRLLVLDQVRRAMQRSAASDSRSLIDSFLGIVPGSGSVSGTGSGEAEARGPKRVAKSGDQHHRAGSEKNGMDHIAYDETVACLFKDDLRVDEVVSMLDSSCVLDLPPPPANDSNVDDNAQTALARLALRTVALPIGRGAFTLRTLDELDEASPLTMPEIVMRGPPREVHDGGAVSTVGEPLQLRPEDVPQLTWPGFQNGVASALRISEKTRVEPSWILLTRAAAQQRAASLEAIVSNTPTPNAADEFAGSLLGLALNGQLRLDTFNVFECLTRAHEPTSIALLLGLACQRRGSADRDVLRLLAIHVRSCLPLAVAAESEGASSSDADARAHAHTDLGVSTCLQSAALLAFGFLFDRRPSGHVAQALLTEIGRAPANDGDAEQTANREVHALSAGIALGMCMFGQGTSNAAERRFVETALLSRLFTYLNGTKPAETDLSTRSSYNAHVTGPAAALALALIYFDTCDNRVSDWLRTPATQFALDAFLPETLLIRTIAYSLVNWRHIEPTAEWLRSHVPAPLLRADAAAHGGSPLLEIDAETAELTELAVRTGACLSLAIRFAGTFSKAALRTVSNQFLDFLKRFAAPKPSARADAADRCYDVLREAPHFVETCLCALLLALATIMAGSCDVDLLRFLRYFRARPGGPVHADASTQSATVGYGSHVATALSTGLLFLGAGRLSLNNSIDALVPLLLTVYPRFPTSPSDNRYFLQAARNLYVLAAERRTLTVRKLTWRSLVTGRCRPTALIRLRQAESQRPPIVVSKTIPCLLPPLDAIESLTVIVRFADHRLQGRSPAARAHSSASDWLIEFSRGRNWHILAEVLRNGGALSVSADDQFRAFAKRCAVAIDRFMRTPLVDDTLQFRELRLLHTVLASDASVSKRRNVEVVTRSGGDSLHAYSNKVAIERRIEMCFEKKKGELSDALTGYIETGTFRSAAFACFLIWMTGLCGATQSGGLLKSALEAARDGQSFLEFSSALRERFSVNDRNLPAVITLFEVASAAASKLSTSKSASD